MRTPAAPLSIPVKRTLGCAKLLGAKMVGSETAWGACTDEEKAVRAR